MPKYSAKYIAPGNSAPDGWIKYGNIAVDVDGIANASAKPFTMGINESLATTRYVIITDTTNAGLVGRKIAGTSATASADIPTFWVSSAKTDDSFCQLVNRLPGRQGLVSLTSSSGAHNWLISNGYWSSFTQSGNILDIITSTSSIFLIGDFETYGESYTQDRSIIRINQNGTKDTSFNNQNKFSRGTDLKFVRVTPNNEILVISNGAPSSYSGTSSWIHLIDSNGDRINSSNLYDTSKVPLSLISNITEMTWDNSVGGTHSGKVYVGFNAAGLTMSGHTASYIARYNSDWTIDKTFNTYISSTQSGFNSTVNKIKILSDGNIIVGGSFNLYRGSSPNPATFSAGICKLDPDGNLVSSFNQQGRGIANSAVNDIEEDSSGNLYVGGNFTGWNGTVNASNSRLVKLNSNGAKILSGFGSTSTNITQLIYDPNDGNLFVCHGVSSPAGTYGKGIVKILTSTLLVTPNWTVPTYGLDNGNNKIRFDSSSNSLFLFGRAVSYDGYIRAGMFKFNGTTGVVDPSFSKNSRVTDSSVSVLPRDFIIDNNGKLIVVGLFNYFKSPNYAAIKSLANGTIDSSFDTSPFSGYIPNISVKDNKGNIFLSYFISTSNPGYDKIFYLNGAGTNYDAIPNSGYAMGAIKISSTGSYNDSFVPRQAPSNTTVLSMDIDNDRYQLYLGGSFRQTPNPNPNLTNLLRICRVSATSGVIDTSFITHYDATYFGFRATRTATATTAADVNSVKYDPVINKVYCGGDFRGYNGLTASRIIRLTSTGSYDLTFNVGLNGFDASVKVIEVDRTGGPNDGKIYIGGDFSTYNGVSQIRLARLNTDGSLDSSFNVGTGPNGSVRKIIILPNGSLFISGLFTSYNGSSTSYVCRVNTDGSIDGSFNTGTGFQYLGLSDYVTSYSGTPLINNIKYDTAQKIYVIGNFGMYRGVAKNCIVRLYLDGSIDDTFNDNGYGIQVNGNGLGDLILI